LTLELGTEGRQRSALALGPRPATPSARQKTVGLDTTSGDERVQVLSIEADMAPQFGKSDASFGDEPADETRLRTKQGGGLLDSK
jgi:hypothetical protein